MILKNLGMESLFSFLGEKRRNGRPTQAHKKWNFSTFSFISSLLPFATVRDDKEIKTEIPHQLRAHLLVEVEKGPLTRDPVFDRLYRYYISVLCGFSIIYICICRTMGEGVHRVSVREERTVVHIILVNACAWSVGPRRSGLRILINCFVSNWHLYRYNV